ncbi:anti-sigma factor [Robertkochia solimangrovi]|nr:anti-sigma factor [Robertkochia solimangrovi]
METLENLLKDSQNDTLFKEYIELNYSSDLLFADFETFEAKKYFLDRIRTERNKANRKVKVRYLRIASAVAAVFVLGVFLYLGKKVFDPSENTVVAAPKIAPGVDKAVLTLNDGSEVVLGQGVVFSNESLKSDGENLQYTRHGADKIEEQVFNTLTIPRGGHFKMELSDGTMVYLNSETQIKYPVKFNTHQIRTVELIYGEAYFEVTSSNLNSGNGFEVINKNQKVSVLGTMFNVKAYQEESSILTTLVEGKVKVESKIGEKILIPGEQSEVDTEKGNISVKSVNTYDATSWIKGTFSFDHMAFDEIARVMSRWYNVEFQFKTEKYRSLQFNGVFKREQHLEEILMIMQSTSNFKYEVYENKVIIL